MRADDADPAGDPATLAVHDAAGAYVDRRLARAPSTGAPRITPTGVPAPTRARRPALAHA